MPNKKTSTTRKASDLSKKELATYKDLFSKLDVAKRGTVNADQVQEAFGNLGKSVTKRRSMSIIHESDSNGDGSMDFEEFVMGIIHEQDRERLPAYQKFIQLATIWINGLAYRICITPKQKIEQCVLWQHAVKVGSALSSGAARVVAHVLFEPFIILCIMLVAISCVLELEFYDDTNSGASHLQMGRFIHVVEYLTLVVFTLEVILKVVAKGSKPWQYLTEPEEGLFNCFDCLIVVLSLASFFGLLDIGGGGVTIMRLLRLIKIMNKLPQLRTIMTGLVVGVRAVGSIMVLLCLILYLFAIVGMLSFGENDPGERECIHDHGCAHPVPHI
jgi:hypothetical protein